MKQTVTQRDIARLLGVSYMTVNRVLSADGRQAHKVSAELRQRIADAAQQLGYRRNVLASNLAMRRTRTIGMVLPFQGESYFLDVSYALEQTARSLGYQVVSTHRRGIGTGSAEEIEFLSSRMVDGLIVAPDCHNESPDSYLALSAASIPVLLFNNFLPGMPCHYLGTASRRGAMTLCQYLLDLGHRRIAFVGGRQTDYTSNCRFEGYRNALEMAGIPQDPDLTLCYDSFAVENGTCAVERLLELKPTAVMAANDALAIGIFLGLRERGVRVPEQMSLAGYAGMWEGRILTPPLTTVVQPVAELGRRAAELMVDLIENPNQTPIFEELPDQLLVRESCSQPAGS